MSEATGAGLQSKHAWREHFRQQVPSDPVAASARIVEHLQGVLSIDDVVLTFSAMADEPDLAGLTAHGATLALTRTPEAGPLTVHPFGVPREQHRWGFSQPEPGAPELDVSTVSVVLVPAVALGRDGSRLGHGKGYYDELLARVPQAARVGVTWDCRVTASLPMDPHDAYLDVIVTERGVRSVPRRH